MSSEQVPGDDSVEVIRLFECCICHQGLQDAHICSGCSQPFCRKCIDEWLAKETNCPCCRQELSATGLVKARTIDQMQQVVNRLVASETRNRCSEHRKEQLSFFCFPCEQCVCACCLFSELHLEHKDQAVLLDVAYGQYKDKLFASLNSMDERKENLGTSLTQVEVNQNLLTQCLNKQNNLLERLEKDRARTDELHGQVDKLLTDEKDAITLIKMMELLQICEKYLSENHLGIDLIAILDQREQLPETSSLKFHLEQYDEILQKYNMYESLPVTKDGFTWKLKCTKDTIALQLEEGLPGEYTVILGSKPAVAMQFELRTYVDVTGHDELVVDSAKDTAQLELRIQQARSHAERCVQLEHYVKRLEAKNSENELFMRYLADYQSKMGSV